MQSTEITGSSGHTPTRVGEAHSPPRYKNGAKHVRKRRSKGNNCLSTDPHNQRQGTLIVSISGRGWISSPKSPNQGRNRGEFFLLPKTVEEEKPDYIPGRVATPGANPPAKQVDVIRNFHYCLDIDLTRNYLSGKIPPEWGSLKLVNISLLGNRLTGPIPVEFGNISTLANLTVEFNQLSGPIPAELGNLSLLEKLVIQASGLDGPIPLGIGLLTKLSDLIWYQFVAGLKCYLTGNLLSGPVPGWMLQSTSKNMNLFGSSSKGDFSGNVSCLSLRSFPCKRNWSSFYINCGGKEVSLGGNMTYEDDKDPAGASKFYQSRTNWAFSSTGNFLDDDRYRDSFIWTSLSSRLFVKNLELYTDARISPISLTYYGFCLINGKYTVNLHFAEIMFNDGKNYSSLGRRIFHIYIQGNMVQKDFNIEDEAGGIGKEVIKKYTANVTDGTLEIRFYWAGKGTTGLPTRGVYGPLISAISVHNPDFKLPAEHTKGISAGAVVGIVAAATFVIILLLGILWWRGFLIRRDTMGQDGTVIAVKQLSSKSKQGNREFVNEIGMISALQHPHLVKLGYMAPEYAMRGYLTDKADVYSFGIVALEIVSGRSNTSYRTKEYCLYLLDWALVLKQKGDLMELVDPKLGSDFNKIEVTVMINVALLCANVLPVVRPAMSSVVSMLEGRTVLESSSVPDPDASNEQMNLKGMMIDLQRSLETDASEGQIQSMSTDGPSTAASTSGGDLYPLNWDSDILNR
ncbi:hypothetical protein RHSIM_Rhsim04G0036100 [Rhododendron simsii]|uniref:non-specific serine/threonine protein kinase n=1 Tax=Rhododendron simsii TaxID=118357 RepID=A0A834GZP5_RHOSS|nr:hypothetical protein RHSIM_Rhsim04G0036100 [Rhododendron simsii]